MNLPFVMDGCRNLLQIGVGLLALSTLILMAGLLIAHGFRRYGPEAQSFVLRLTLSSTAIGVLLCILFAGHLPAYWQLTLPSLPRMDTRLVETTPSPALTSGSLTSEAATPAPPPPATVLSSEPAPSTPTAGGSAFLSRLYIVVAQIWGLGALLFGIGLFRNLVKLRYLHRTCTEVAATSPAGGMLHELCATAKVAPPQLMAGAQIRSPFLTVLPEAPAIFLPAALITDSLAARDDTLRAVLAHEVAHLKRRDCQWNLLLRLTCALCWPQPLLWRFSRRMEQISEEACDEYAAHQLASPHDYADCLVTLAQRYPPARIERAVGTAVVASRSSLEERIKQLMNRSSSSRPPLSPSSRLVLSAGSAFVVIGSVLLVGGSLTLPLRAEQTVGPPSLPLPPLEPEKERLRWALVDLNFKETPAREVLNALFKDTGMSYRFAPGLESRADSPVTLEVKTAPVWITLDMIVHHLGRHPDRLTYSVEGDIVTIRTRASTLDERGLPLRRVTVNFTNVPLRTVLDKMFSGTNVGYYLPVVADTPVSVAIQDMPFDAALNTVLQTVLRSARRPLDYYVNDAHVTFYEKRLSSRPYDIVSPDIPTIRVSGDFNGVPLRQVIKEIFKPTMLHYSLSRDAYGTVNVRLKDVPLDAALRKILAQSNPPLRAYRQPGGTIIIVPVDSR